MARILHRIEVIEIAEEFIETMNRRKESVEISQMVLAKLSCGVAHRFENRRDCGSFVGNADLRTSLTNRSQTRADWNLSGDEVRPPCRAACFGVIVGEPHSFSSESI